MRMLDDLRDYLDEIERESDWEYRFLTDIMERKEANPEYRLTAKQFCCLANIHDKYCRGR